MRDERWVVLGVAPVRAEWFAALARWSTAGVVPVELVKCLSVDEVASRLRSGRPHSALLVDERTIGLDRALLEEAASVGCAPFVVGDGRRWSDAAAAELPTDFDRGALLAALHHQARPVASVEGRGAPADDLTGPWRGHLIAVTGVPGAGASTTAMALAQHLAADPRHRGSVALADLRLDADLALLHDAGDVGPGVLELVEASRRSSLTTSTVRGLLHADLERGYDLLLGLRRHHDWTAMPERTTAAAVDGLRQAYRLVVADVGCDVEGEELTGSLDVGDRNALARTTLERCHQALVVGRPGLRGVHRLARCITRLLAAHVPAVRLQPVVVAAPRRRRERAQIVEALAALTAGAPGSESLPAPVHLPAPRGIERDQHDAVALPSSLGAAIARPVDAALERLVARPPVAPGTPVVPGRIGSWTEATPGVAG